MRGHFDAFLFQDFDTLKIENGQIAGSVVGVHGAVTFARKLNEIENITLEIVDCRNTHNSLLAE